MDLTRMLKALADDTRRCILQLLLRRSFCARALARNLDISEAAVSQHLKVLREAGLLTGSKQGCFIHYEVNRDALRTLAQALDAMSHIEQLPCAPVHGGCAQAEYAGCRNAQQSALAPAIGNKRTEVSSMKIAVTYENGMVFQHFGHCEQFKLYEVENGAVQSSELVSAIGSGHGALAGFLQAHGVQTLICGGIGGGARVALAQAGIDLYPGVTGEADASVQALLDGTLSYNPDTMCNHHHHGEGHSCGSHACGENKHGCAGNH